MIRTVTMLLLVFTAALACGGERDTAPGDTGEVSGTPSISPAPDTGAMAGGATPTGGGPPCWLQRGTPEEAAQRTSPRTSATTSLGEGTLTVCYGAPSARGRTIIGGQDPYGTPWRMGADEATALHTTIPIQIADVRLEPGAYSIYGIPDQERWTLVINRQSERWGIPIDEGVRSADVGEIQVTPEPGAQHVETLRYGFEPAGEGRVDLIMEFETTRLRVPIQAVGT